MLFYLYHLSSTTEKFKNTLSNSFNLYLYYKTKPQINPLLAKFSGVLALCVIRFEFSRWASRVETVAILLELATRCFTARSILRVKFTCFAAARSLRWTEE